MSTLQDAVYTLARDLRERIRHEADWGLAGHEKAEEAPRTLPSQEFVNALSAPAQPSAAVAPAQPPPQAPAAPPAPTPVAPQAPAAPRAAKLSENTIPVAIPVEPARKPSIHPAPDLSALGTIAPGAEGLARVQEVLGDCQRCGLHEGRENLVFGRGNPTADLLFIGEGPGAAADRRYRDALAGPRHGVG